MQTHSQSETNFLFERIEELKSRGITPYTKQFTRSMKLFEVNEDHEAVGSEYESESVTLSLAGRVMIISPAEDWILVTIEDQDSRLQLSLDAAHIGQSRLDDFRHAVYRGDYLGFEVDYIYREAGRLTARVSEWCFLALCFLPLPLHLRDTERQRRQRFVHYAMSIDARQHFLMRSKIAQYVRYFLEERDFVEELSGLSYMSSSSVNITPTNRNALFNEQLAIHLRHYLVGGIEQVYKIDCTSQRGNIERINHPQVQIMQCCMMLADLEDAMRFVEQLISRTVMHFNAAFAAPWVALEELRVSEARVFPNPLSTLEIDFTPVWPRRPVAQLVNAVIGDYSAGITLDEAVNAAVQIGIDIGDLDKSNTVDDIYRVIMHHCVGSTLVQPTFVVYPSSDEDIEHFELYVNGIKFAEGNSRTGNPLADKFLNGLHDDESLTSLKYGLPPVAELAVSIDYLAMALLGAHDIRDVIPFPEGHL